MLISLLVALTINIAEARVFCHDPHATRFITLGFSCAISCNTIFSAIQRLKQIEYQRLVIQHGGKLPYTTNSSKIQKVSQRRNTELDAEAQKMYIQTYEAYSKIELSHQYLSEFKAQISNLTSMLNVTCYVNTNRSKLLRKVLNECTRDAEGRHCRGCILRSFRTFFNKYAHPEHPFDTSMVLIILKSILSNVKIRNGGIIDNVVMYLKRELRPYASRQTLDKKDTVTIQSKNCMTVSMPGCFCEEGYVEDMGRCVMPSNCSQDADFAKYIDRIILH